MADFKLDDDVRDVLIRATAEGLAIFLPKGQLERKLYERVNKALTNAGGKWNRQTGAHLFKSDAGPKLVAMLGSGVSVDEKKRDQSFFTPPELAREVVELADVYGRRVLEPSAGRGALADACRAAGAKIIQCVEINVEYYTALWEKGHICQRTDFLTFPIGKRFERIVMNPPFTKNQDIKHVNHALKWLAPGGILVAIMMDSQRRKGFEEIVAKYNPEVIEVERGAFKESGTMIPTIIVKIEKEK